MPLDFQSRSHSSFDLASGVSIPRPRILPTTLPCGQRGTEYQYAFIRGGKRIGGLGFEGPDAIVETNGRREWVFTFDLTCEQTISSMLSFKEAFGSTDDDLTYLRDLARGLLLAYAGRADNVESLRYLAITASEALVSAGVVTFDTSLVLPDSTLVLSEIVVPARADRGHAS
ncbi:hypothetical protein ABE473_16680 [Stenotrophomonas sp. TWI700]|uniref:hypothetical protein n=1 Tax=Stenotrophomonas sp. TWI700 TaxID=3136792 RepID=UPI00320A7EE8